MSGIFVNNPPAPVIGGAAVLQSICSGTPSPTFFSAAGANFANLYALVIPYDVTFSSIYVDLNVADNSAHVYDVGIYDSTGNLRASWGGVAGSAMGTTVTAMVGFSNKQGTVTIPKGVYAFVTAGGASTTAKLLFYASVGGCSPWTAQSVSGGATSGVLNNSISMPTAAPTNLTVSYPVFCLK